MQTVTAIWSHCRCKALNSLGRGGGHVVSVLVFYSDDPSSNPAEAYSFYTKNKK